MDYRLNVITIVELPEFIRRAKRLLTESERESMINHLASNPVLGVIMEGTGGIRKLRWKRQGSGKSGGVRVIYYYHNQHYPLFLLTIFGKSERVNLTKAERNELGKLIQILIANYGKKS